MSKDMAKKNTKESSILKVLAYFLKCEKYIGPVTVTYNENTNRIELCSSRFAFWIILNVFLLSSMIYALTAGGIEDYVFELTPAYIILSNFLAVFMICWYLNVLYVCTFVKNDIIRNWNNFLKWEQTFATLGLKCQIRVKVTMFATFAPAIINFIYTATQFNSDDRFRKFNTTKVLTGLAFGLFTNFSVMFQNYRQLLFVMVYTHYFEQLNVITKEILANPSDQNSIRLKKVASCHQLLCHITKATLNTFTQQILITHNYCLVFLMMHVYQFITTINEGGWSVLDLISGLLNIFVISVIVFRFILPCVFCMNEANDLKRLLASHVIDQKHSNMTKHIKIIMLQLQHEHLKLNAGGVLDLDISTIGQMIGTLTTYMILLLQSSDDY